MASSPIGIDEYIVKCPSCESEQLADVMIVSNYYHFFYIPIFPIGKEANIFCKKCGLKRYGAALDSKLFINYQTPKKRYRHSWFTYIGIVVLLLPFLIAIIFAIFK